MGKSVCVPVDSSEGSKRALNWALINLMKQPDDKLSLLCVQHALSDPFAAEAAATPFSDPVQAQVPEEVINTARHPDAKQVCDTTLDEFRRSAVAAGLPERQISTAQVSPNGGACGVGESIVQYVKHTGQDIVVVGSRGMGAVKRAVLSLAGVGSVSEYAVNHLHCPVVVVKSSHKDAAVAATASKVNSRSGGSSKQAAGSRA